ncbi:MAG: cytochrome c biogenesis protein [Flavobacteriales bacterium]
MKHWWWKIAAVILLLAASVAGLYVPLAPALVHVAPDRLGAGSAEILVTGYNTRFEESMPVRFSNGGDEFCPQRVVVLDATHMKLFVEVPVGLRAAMTDLAIGNLSYPGAFYSKGGGSGFPAMDCGDGTPSPTVGGFTFPNQSILYESIRNLHFHVPMWFAMIALMGMSVWHSIKGLSGTGTLEHDRAALSAVEVGLWFCALGLLTGSLWARATWGTFWTNDVKLNGAAVTALIYLAYLVLRGSITDPYKRARLASIYNVFAFALLVLFLFVVPRLNEIDSLHPGNGGNSGFNDLDLDNRLRIVFYPAVAGWVLMGLWMAQLRTRATRLAEQMEL